MGQPKLLLPWGQHALIEQVLDSWRQGGVETRIVVVHPEDRQLADVCRAAGATVCLPAAPPLEMKDSVWAALSLASQLFPVADDDAWLLAPADMPFLSADLIRTLVGVYARGESSIIVPRLPSGRTGHPVLFAWRHAFETEQLAQGVNELLLRHSVTYVEWHDAGAFADVDTFDDYRRLQSRHNQPTPSRCRGPANSD